MECAHHAGRQAVATCNRCGKGLCSECAERFDPPLCVACLLTHNRGVAIRLAAELAITAFIGVGITVFVGSRAGGTWESGLFLGTIATCAYWGWQFVGGLSSPSPILPVALILAILLPNSFLLCVLGSS